MRQKGQLFIYNDKELELIKNTFSENEDLLYAIRNVLLQFPLSDLDKQNLKLLNDDVVAVIKKRIFPQIDSEAPLTQLSDMYQTLNEDLKTKSIEEMDLLFEAKILEVDYLTQQFSILRGLNVEEVIKLDELANLKGKNSSLRFIHTKARNFLLPFVDSMLMLLKNIAGSKNETVEETKKRLDRNSNK